MPKGSSGRERYNERKAEQLREQIEWNMLDARDQYHGELNENALKLVARDIKKIIYMNQATEEDRKLLTYVRHLQGDTDEYEAQWRREDEEQRLRAMRRRTPRYQVGTSALKEDFELPF